MTNGKLLISIFLIFASVEAQKILMLNNEDFQKISSLSKEEPNNVNVETILDSNAKSLSQENENKNGTLSILTIKKQASSKDETDISGQQQTIVTQLTLESGNQFEISVNKSDAGYSMDGTTAPKAKDVTNMSRNIVHIINLKHENVSNNNQDISNNHQDDVNFQTPILVVNSLSPKSEQSNIQVSDIGNHQNLQEKKLVENQSELKREDSTNFLVTPIVTDVRFDDESSPFSHAQNSSSIDYGKITVKINDLNSVSQNNENIKNLDFNNNSNVSLSNKALPISITFSTQSNKQVDSTNTSFPIQNEPKTNKIKIVKLSNTQELNINHSENEQNNFEKEPENFSKQSIDIKLSPKKSNSETESLSRIHLIGEEPNNLENVVFKDLDNIEPQQNINSRLIVGISPIVNAEQNPEQLSGQQTHNFNSEKNITLNEQIMENKPSIHINVFQNEPDKKTVINGLGEIQTNVSSDVKPSNLNTITIQLSPTYSSQPDEIVKSESNSQIFTDNNTTISINDLTKLINNTTELVQNDIPTQVNKIHQQVFQTNDSSVAIHNMLNGSSSLLKVIIGSEAKDSVNEKKADLLDSEQPAINSSKNPATRNAPNEEDIISSEIEKFFAGQTYSQDIRKNLEDATNTSDSQYKTYTISQVLKNSVENKTSDIQEKIPNLILLETNQSPKIISLNVDTSNINQQNEQSYENVENQSQTSSLEKQKNLIDKISNELTSFFTSSSIINQSSLLNIPDSEVKQNDQELINNEYSEQNPSDKLNGEIDPENAHSTLQEYLDNYGTPNLNIILKESEGIPELILDDNFFTSKEKLLITTSQGDKFILYEDHDNISNAEPSSQTENKDIPNSNQDDIQPHVGNAYLHTDGTVSTLITRRNRNTDRGPLWWVNTNNGFVPEGGAQATKGFVFNVEDDDDLDGFQVDDIDLKSSSNDA